MRIFSKKSFALGEGVTKNNPDGVSIVTVPGTFQTIPDYLVNDPMFKAAKAEGSILVVNDKNDEAKAEATASEGAVKDLNAKSDAEKFYEELKGKDREQTLEIAEQYGIKVAADTKLGKIKQMIMTAYKSATAEAEEEEESTEE